MIWFLRVLFLGVLAGMLWVTGVASLDRGVFTAGAALWPDPWFRATLADAYFGFLVVYLWIAYKERGWGTRLLWLVLLMALGNIAIAVYMLWHLFRLDADASIEELLLRQPLRGDSRS